MARRRKRRLGLKITAIVLAAIIGILGVCVGVGAIGYASNFKLADGYAEVGRPLTPEIDPETGYWTFTTDRDFRILQLTDVHIGGGFLSIGKDKMAIEAVSELVTRAKADLVIATGDIAYPFPLQSGSFNNLREAELFAKTMESLGVYYAIAFGNHDTESYSFYNREEICDFYSKQKYCLLQAGPKDVDGVGNYVINVKNTAGYITQSIFLMDTHAYVKEGGLLNNYDGLHENQIAWYKNEVVRLSAINAEISGVSEVVDSMLFIHIPLGEYKSAWEEYSNNGHKDTENVKFYQGIAREDGEKVCSSAYPDQMFETMQELGSTRYVFAGHDHLNTWSVDYKGIRLTYGMSIDHLAYFGIVKKTEQRGGTIITSTPEGEVTIAQERLVK